MNTEIDFDAARSVLDNSGAPKTLIRAATAELDHASTVWVVQTATTLVQQGQIAELESVLKSYVARHDADVRELGEDAGMESPPNMCDCDLCDAARPLLKG